MELSDWNPCSYCGQSATTKDHLESRTWTGHRTQGFRGPWVWACQECNSILGDKRIPDQEDRKVYVANRLTEMYWGEAMRPLPELDGLEGNLRRYTEYRIEQRQMHRERLEYATGSELPPPPTAVDG